MKLDEQLVNFLANSTGLVALVGTRIHEGTVPEQDAFPFVWFRRASRAAQGALTSFEINLVETHFAVECVATTVAESQSVADEIRTLLHEYRGFLVFSESPVQAVFVEDAADDYIPRNDGGDNGLFVTSLDVAIFTAE